MNIQNLYTLIPKMDELLESEDIKKLMISIPRKTVIDSIRQEIDSLRKQISKGISEDEISIIISHLLDKIILEATKRDSFKLRRIINATGVVIHTNLGRSLINKKTMENIQEIATNYSNLEYDLENATRGSRYSHLEEIISTIIGCESSMVVNNNAAAVMLVLSTMARHKEVIVSRGELVEIGGSFRIPEVMEQSGAILIDVGTTNKTHLEDYEKAINENTAALLKVHTSNYRILGFTSSVDLDNLFELKGKYGIPIIEDLGSGVLIDLSKYGLEYEPTVQESIRKGVDIVTFSGDKLLGGPQSGIIAGKKEYIDRMKKNPLTRAFRVDKFTIAALEGTLKYYLDEEIAVEEVPTLSMLTASIDKIFSKAQVMKELIDRDIDSDYLNVEIEDSYSEVGGGSLPMEKIPTKCIVLSINGKSTQGFEHNLRRYRIPIITRINKNKIYFDLRTISEDEIFIAVNGIKYALDKIEECN